MLGPLHVAPGEPRNPHDHRFAGSGLGFVPQHVREQIIERPREPLSSTTATSSQGAPSGTPIAGQRPPMICLPTTGARTPRWPPHSVLDRSRKAIGAICMVLIQGQPGCGDRHHTFSTSGIDVPADYPGERLESIPWGDAPMTGIPADRIEASERLAH